jgi:hypothetical protein
LSEFSDALRIRAATRPEVAESVETVINNTNGNIEMRWTPPYDNGSPIE